MVVQNDFNGYGVWKTIDELMDQTVGNKYTPKEHVE